MTAKYASIWKVTFCSAHKFHMTVWKSIESPMLLSNNAINQLSSNGIMECPFHASEISKKKHGHSRDSGMQIVHVFQKGSFRRARDMLIYIKETSEIYCVFVVIFYEHDQSL